MWHGQQQQQADAVVQAGLSLKIYLCVHNDACALTRASAQRAKHTPVFVLLPCPLLVLSTVRVHAPLLDGPACFFLSRHSQHKELSCRILWHGGFSGMRKKVAVPPVSALFAWFTANRQFRKASPPVDCSTSQTTNGVVALRCALLQRGMEQLVPTKYSSVVS